MKPSNPNLSRRSFLKTTSSALAGGALLGSLSVERSAYAAGSDTLKLALIGCGGRGTGAAVQALSTRGSVKLVAMADVFRDHLERSLKNISEQFHDHPERVSVADDHKFIGFDAYKHAIAAADVVILTTPPGFRPIQFEEAVRQGKNIFMEKPVAVDAPGIRRILKAGELAKEKRLKVGVGLQRHHQLGYLETVRRLHEGDIGPIVSMRAYWDGGPVGPKATRSGLAKLWGRQPTEMEYQVRNWYMFTWLCGDHIVEQHIHNLDVINWVKQGYPVRAQGMGGRAFQKGPDSGQIFDHHFVEFEYADGSRLYSQCRQIPNCWNSVSEHVTGRAGISDVSGFVIEGKEKWRHNARGDRNPYQVEHDDLFHAIRNDIPYSEVEYGAKSTMTAIMGRMATYSGKKITWEEVFNSKLDLSPKEYSWSAQPPVLPQPNGLYPHAIPGQTVAL